MPDLIDIKHDLSRITSLNLIYSFNSNEDFKSSLFFLNQIKDSTDLAKFYNV
jgi:hypothetical protein